MAEEIKRPDNVIIPRWLQAKIDARNRRDMTATELRASLRRAGIDPPKGAKVDELRSMLYDQSASAEVMGRTDNTSKE